MKNRLLFLFIVLISNLGNCSFCTAQNQQKNGMSIKERYVYANQVILPKALELFPFLLNDSISYTVFNISYQGFPAYSDTAYSYEFVNKNYFDTVAYTIKEGAKDDGFAVRVSNDFRFSLRGLYIRRGTLKNFLPAFYKNIEIVTQKLSTDPQNVNARFFADGGIVQLDSNSLSNRRFTDRNYRFMAWDNYTTPDTLRIDSLKLSIAGEITEVLNITNNNQNQYLVANINYTPNPSGGSYLVQLAYQLYTAANGVVWSYHTPLDSVYNYVISPTTVSDINKDKDCELNLLFYKKDRTGKLTSVILIFVANKKTYMLIHNDGEETDQKQLDEIPIEYRNDVNIEWRKIVNKFNLIKKDPINITELHCSINHDVSCYMPSTTVDSDRMIIKCFEYKNKKKDFLFIARKGKLYDNKIYGDIHMGAEEEIFLRENTNLIMHSKSFAIPRKKGSNQDAMIFQFTLDDKVIHWRIPYNLSSKDIMYIKHHIPSDKIIYILDKYAHPDDFSNYLRITNAFLREEERSNKNDSTTMNELPLPNKKP